MSDFYRPRLLVEARQLPATVDTIEDTDRAEAIAIWAGGELMSAMDGEIRLWVSDSEGDSAFDLGTWVIKGHRGSIFTCRTEDFASIYEPAVPSLKEATG